MSGKDLVQNHLTYFIYCHTAMWPNDKSVPTLLFLPCCGLCPVVVVFVMLLWSLSCCGLCHVVVVFVMLWSLSCCFGFAVMLWSLSWCCGLCHVVVVFLGKASPQAPSQLVLVKQKQKGPVFIPGALSLSNRGKMALSTWRMLCTCQTEPKWPCLHGGCFVLVKQRQNDPVYMEDALYLSNRGKMTLSTWKVLCTCQTGAKWTFFMPGACSAWSQ